MTLRAMGLATVPVVLGRVDAPPNVGLVSDDLQMIWIAAVPYSAEMVEFFARRDVSAGEKEDGTVSAGAGIETTIDPTVAASIDVALPDPATIRVGLGSSQEPG